ncbi:MAG: DUF2946 family protein [Sphingomonadaceae bacterium]
MDDIVVQAMAKWPDVPHCYGWLGLDGRGHWRMRDEQAQQLGLAGDKLSNPALVGFILRNYASDERGCWYFQNGPQRVYLELETAPFVVRTDPASGWRLHTGALLGVIDAAALTADGALLLRSGAIVAQLDDRDFAQVLPRLELDGAPVADDALLAWLAQERDGTLLLRDGDRSVPLQRLASAQVPAYFSFVRSPAALQRA